MVLEVAEAGEYLNGRERNLQLTASCQTTAGVPYSLYHFMLQPAGGAKALFLASLLFPIA